MFPTLHCRLYFEIGCTILPVSALRTPRRLDAVRMRRGAPPADQGERGEESQRHQESECRTGWIPGGRPEREPRCHGRGLSSGNCIVKTVHTASRAGRCFEAGCWGWEGGGRRTVQSRLLSPKIRDPITFLGMPMIYMTSGWGF